MSCDRCCFQPEWKYGEIDCDDCPGQDANISMERREELEKKLKEKSNDMQ